MSTLFGGNHTVAKSATRAMGIDLQGAQYGAPIPVVFGQNKVAGNVVWYGDFKSVAHQQKQGGKGGGSQTSTSYTYSASFELGLCEGTATIVNVYQGGSTVNLSASGGIAFNGAVGQAAWSHLTGSAALGYSGTALAAFQNLSLGSSASLPNFNFEMAGRNQFGGGIVDANPADIITTICTDTQLGVKFAYLGNLTAFKNYCSAAGLFFSPVYKTQNPALQTLTDLFKYANSAAWFSEGQLKVVPYGDQTLTGNGVTYTPVMTAVASLGANDFITNGSGAPVTIKRISPADAMNLVRLEYKDRANTYHTGAVVASIDQDVVSTGSRAEQSMSVDMITGAAVARLVAQNLLQRIYYIRNTYEFQLSWRYCYLEPMDIVTLTDANTGLYLSPVRITEISEDDHGLLSVIAEELPDGIGHGGTYATQANAGTNVDTNHDPGPVTSPYLFRGPGFLVSNGSPEIWCAVTGTDPLWAGCDVYLSHDGTSYTYLATYARQAAYGSLTNTLAANADPDTTGTPNVSLNGPAKLLGGSQADADQFVTLAMLDNEIISYQTSTLASGPSYTLGYLRRGGYGSAIASHAAGAPFVRLDENILRLPVDPSMIGQTIYIKFVSFNAFGKGGRTLASETAYTYVIGTNIELPDVPVTPASFAAASVADGVSLTWTNPNPAAVGSTSIEYATASTGPWTVLAQVGPTTTAFAHHFTSGSTYYYRARSRGYLISAGFSAYTATFSSSGVNVSAIASNANTALSLANQVLVQNPGFDAGNVGWTYNAGWSIKSDSAGPGAGVGYAQFNATGANAAIYNNAYGPVQAGQTYKTQALIKAIGANGVGYVRISWCNASLTEIGSVAGNTITGTTTNGSYAIGQAPAGALYARTSIEVDSCTVGTYQVDNVVATLQPSNQSEVPNGGGHNSVTAIDPNGLALIDFGQAGHVSKNLDNIGDGATYGRMYGTDLTGGRLDFSKGLLNKQLDNMPDGTTYVRLAGSYANANRPIVNFNDTFHVNKTLDYMGDGTTYLRMPGANMDVNRRGLVDFSQTGHVNKNVDNLADGTTYGRPLLSRLSAGNPLIDFSAAYHLNKNLDNVADGATYLRGMQLSHAIGALTVDDATFQLPGLNGWSAVSNCSIFAQSASPAPTIGGQYLVVSTTAAGGGYAQASRVYSCNPGDSISIGGLLAAISGVYSAIQADFYTAAGAYISAVVASNSATAWTAVKGSGVVPATAAKMQLSLHCNTASAYACFNYVWCSVNDIRVAGSGVRLGNQNNLPQRTVANYPSKVNASSSYTSTTTSATISVAAFSTLSGSVTISYNAMSTTVSGTTGTVLYYLYLDDPGAVGGTQTLVATTTANDLYAGDGRINLSTISVIYPASGTGGGGGAPPVCVCAHMFIDADTLADEARPGYLFDCLDIPTQGMRKFRRRLQSVEYATVPCVRITTELGGVWEGSTTTPFDLLGGGFVYAPDMLGEQVVTDKGIETVARVDDIGEQPVCHIHLGGVSYAAGADPEHRIFSHNNSKP